MSATAWTVEEPYCSLRADAIVATQKSPHSGLRTAAVTARAAQMAREPAGSKGSRPVAPTHAHSAYQRPRLRTASASGLTFSGPPGLGSSQTDTSRVCRSGGKRVAMGHGAEACLGAPASLLRWFSVQSVFKRVPARPGKPFLALSGVQWQEQVRPGRPQRSEPTQRSAQREPSTQPRGSAALSSWTRCHSASGSSAPRRSAAVRRERMPASTSERSSAT